MKDFPIGTEVEVYKDYYESIATKGSYGIVIPKQKHSYRPNHTRVQYLMFNKNNKLVPPENDIYNGKYYTLTHRLRALRVTNWKKHMEASR